MPKNICLGTCRKTLDNVKSLKRFHLRYLFVFQRINSLTVRMLSHCNDNQHFCAATTYFDIILRIKYGDRVRIVPVLNHNILVIIWGTIKMLSNFQIFYDRLLFGWNPTSDRNNVSCTRKYCFQSVAPAMPVHWNTVHENIQMAVRRLRLYFC